jgi:hypothetical protein
MTSFKVFWLKLFVNVSLSCAYYMSRSSHPPWLVGRTNEVTYGILRRPVQFPPHCIPHKLHDWSSQRKRKCIFRIINVSAALDSLTWLWDCEVTVTGPQTLPTDTYWFETFSETSRFSGYYLRFIFGSSRVRNSVRRLAVLTDFRVFITTK